MEITDQNASFQSPLIQYSGQDGPNVYIEQNKKFVVARTEIVEEVKKQLWLARPLIFVILLSFCLQVISVMFVGHLGELPLAGASMATSFCTVTGVSIMLTSIFLFCILHIYIDTPFTIWNLSFLPHVSYLILQYFLDIFH
ncbi:hypothetical protein Lalb_Chr05g0221921 [Lupinus albus]|uniref:Uncharacterized protein n=1 Tax=Lupinus albus TaxID=3870 RepID=A0A6A4QL46_LUPAL|nr:hypothetical protein Lalb_Chr05g0221921 [Lupinus albus]